ncbi:MAG: acyl-CoA dehydrogenase family protein [Acidimicrobiales bacterium]
MIEARRIGEQVARQWADDVDRDARFPAETVAELRSSGLLGALVPPEWGGPGAPMDQVAGAVAVIAEHCASSALILAMHQIQVACLVRHATHSALDQLLPRLVAGELLLANANSEVGLGGERRSSICALEPAGDGFHLEKQASTISYGEYADAILATARRDPASSAHDQVMAICMPPGLRLTPSGDWDTLGLRGTCSRPGQLTAEVAPELVLADYATVFMRTSLPVSAVLLSSVWLGIAEAGAKRAHASVRAEARKKRRESSQTDAPIGALRLAELSVLLHQIRQVVTGGAADYERYKDTAEVEALHFSGRMDNLKLSSSVLVIAIVQQAMAICGLAGYRNHSPFSMARLMRDAAAAPLMVNNDRALLATAQTLLVRKAL